MKIILPSDLESLDYWGALRLAKDTAWNINHGGWIIHQDESIKYTLDTLDEGRSFRIAQWEPGKLTGMVARTIPAPPEIEFLFSLRWTDEDDE